MIGVKLTKVYCKHMWTYHNETPLHNILINGNKNVFKMFRIILIPVFIIKRYW
jgi:hypothetical protein